MIDNLRVLGLIPARGGSKGVPRKNVLPIDGKPLIGWAIGAAKASRLIDRLIVSTDNDEIMDVARTYQADVPFRRPAELATDTASSVGVALHAVEALSEHYDLLVLIQPTSPFVTPEDIDGCISRCVTAGGHSCASVYEVDKGPYWMYRLAEDGRMQPLMDGPRPQWRQDAPACFILNGAVWVCRPEWLRANGDFVGEGTLGYEMPKDRSIDIDTLEDFAIAETLLRVRRETGGLM